MKGNEGIKSFAKAYKIHSVENHSYVWDSSGNPKELNTLILVKYHGGDNQKFYLTPTQSGKWNIMCLHSGFALTPKPSNKLNLSFETAKGSPEEEWELIELKPNVFIIKSGNGSAIEVAGGTYKNEAKLFLYPQDSGPNQQWVLEKV